MNNPRYISVCQDKYCQYAMESDEPRQYCKRCASFDIINEPLTDKDKDNNDGLPQDIQ